MKTIYLYIPQEGASFFAIAGLTTILNSAKAAGLQIAYRLVGFDYADSKHDQYKFNRVEDLNNLPIPDFFLIPPCVLPAEKFLEDNRLCIQWMKSLHHSDVKIASFCTGVYLLAESGLLDQKEASSHPTAIPDLADRYPAVRWVSEKVITDQASIYTSGGTISSFNLLIYLICKYFDHSVGLHIARFMQLEYPRIDQKPYYIFSNLKNHPFPQIKKIQDYFESHLDEKVNLDEVARIFALSRRSLNRKFKAATGLTPLYYWQRVKIEQAKQWLENGQLSIGEIAFQVGYNDENSFREMFKKITGTLPSAYKRKYA